MLENYVGSARAFFVVSVSLCCVQGSVRGSSMERSRITFEAPASGGTLTLTEARRSAVCVSLVTSPGESRESVATRLAALVNESDPFEWAGDSFRPGHRALLLAAGGTLNGFPGPQRGGIYILAGTERGLGIPPPPTSLSCTYHSQDNRIILRWLNPADGFDSIAIVRNGATCALLQDGRLTRYETDRKGEWQENRVNICVVGYRGDVPSNAAGITFDFVQNAQEELAGNPFTGGVAPNWTAWSANGKLDAIRLEQGEKRRIVGKRRSQFPYPVKAADKVFFQLIRTSSATTTGGVWRKFLGLIPGHTYRVSVRLNTLAMDQEKQTWAFAFHAACNAPDGAELSEAQLAGSAALPDGSTGPEAGQIAAYGPDLTTKGQWVERHTGDTQPGRKIGDITLPPDVDTITLWFRYSGPNTSGVGFDWVQIQDLSSP
jgi:hypothetical protein